MRTGLGLGLALAAGLMTAGAATAEQKNNRGYIVGKGGVARVVTEGSPQPSSGEAEQATGESARKSGVVIPNNPWSKGKGKGGPIDARDPGREIGINEPGINRARTTSPPGTGERDAAAPF